MIRDFFLGTGGLNEYPLVRMARYMMMAAAAAVVTVAIQELPGIDFPGTYDAAIVIISTPLLAGADKWLRDRMAPKPAA